MKNATYIVLTTALLFASVQVEAGQRATFNGRKFPNGIVDGQKGWSVTQGTASVNTGSKYLQVDSGSSATLPLASSSNTLFFSSYRVTPYAGSTAASSVFLDMSGSKVAFVDVGGGEGEIYALDGQSGVWVPTGHKVALDGNNRAVSKIFLSVRQDFSAAKEWDLFVINGPIAPNGYPLAMALTYVDDTISSPQNLVFVGHSDAQ